MLCDLKINTSILPPCNAMYQLIWLKRRLLKYQEKLQHILANTPKKNIKVLMGGMNAKIDQNNKNRERIIWKHSIGKINKNNDRLARFVGQIISGGSIRRKHIPLTNIHKTTWNHAPNDRTKNQINCVMINKRWRSI